MYIWWWFFLQVVGTPNHSMMSSNFFPSQVVGTLKPSITCASLPLDPPSLPASPPHSLPCPLAPCLAPHSLPCPLAPYLFAGGDTQPLYVIKLLPSQVVGTLKPSITRGSEGARQGARGSEGARQGVRGKGARGEAGSEGQGREQGGEAGSKGARQGVRGQGRELQG